MNEHQIFINLVLSITITYLIAIKNFKDLKNNFYLIFNLFLYLRWTANDFPTTTVGKKTMQNLFLK